MSVGPVVLNHGWGTTLTSGRKDEAQLDGFVAHAPVAMAVFDREMRCLAVSERWLRDSRLDRSPVGLLIEDAVPEISGGWKAVHRRCLAGASESSEGEPFPRAGGQVQWVKWAAGPWRDSDGNIGGVILTTEDITARKAAEAEAARLASVVRHASDAIVALALDSIVTAWNEAATRLFGYSADEMVGQSIDRIIPAERLAEEGRILEQLRAGETVDPFETQRVARDGTILEVSLSISPIRDGTGAIVGAWTIMRDVTAQNRTRRELAAAAAILASENETTPDGILVVDPTSRAAWFNRRFGELFEIPQELLAEQDDGALLARAGRQVLDAEAFERRARSFHDRPEESGHDEVFFKDGRVIDRFTSPFKTANGEYGGRIWYFRDVTERWKGEESLRASEERFRMLFEAAPDAVLLYDFDKDCHVAANRAAARLFGVSRDELLQKGTRYFYATEKPDGRPVAQSFSEHCERALAGEEVTYERRIRRPSGEERVTRATLVRLPSNVRLLRSSFVDVTEQDRAQRELASTAAILATEHESSPDGILVIDPTGRIISLNRRFREIFDLPDELLAVGDDVLVRALASQKLSDPEEFERRVRDLYDHPDESSHDELLLKDGRVLDRFTSPFKTADGELMGRIWFFRDITERRRGEESLRASEERFRTLIEEAPDAILLYDFDRDRFVSANRAAERLFGVSRDEILEKGAVNFYTPEQPDGRAAGESFREHHKRALAGEEVTFERRIRRPSSEERICRATLVRLPSHVRLIRTSLVDMTEQRAAEAQLSEVTLSTVRREEAERQRIARELHDSIGQYLAGMTMKLDALGSTAPDASPLKLGLSELKNLTTTVGSEMRRLAWELRPAALDDLGLEPAIEHFVDEWSRRSGLRFDLHCALNGRRLPPDVETTLYRGLQEAVTNIVKHAGARKVGVSLDASPRGVVMMIEDDGKGFEPETVNRRSTRHFGLLGMRERLALIRGSLEIESEPCAGTTLLMRVPLNDPSAPSI